MALMAGKNKNPSAQYAFIGLILALLACIATGLIGTAQGMVAAKMIPLESAYTDGLKLALQISIALLIVGLAAYAIMAPDTVRRFFSGRQARYGSNAVILALAVLGILFVANMLAFQNPCPWKTCDLTSDKINTLAPETLQALATLPEKVTVTAFYSRSLNPASAEELLLKFKTNSDGKFDYKFVDPDQDPLAAREAGVTGDGKILLHMGETKEIASYADETELTKALIRLISPQERVVYFLEGHGEPPLEATSDKASFSTAKATLESKNYTVKPLNLLTTNSIPEDALSIIIGGPKKPLTESEVALLKEYVNAGGSLVVMEDPTMVTEFGDSPDPLAKYLTSDWGITLNNDIVIDTVSTQNPLVTVSSQIGMHPITQNLTRNYVVVLPQARSIGVIAAANENITQTPLMTTPDQSWGETELVAGGTQPTFDPAKDNPGPLYLAVAGENTSAKERVVIFGNSVFATDAGFDTYGNGNMFINSVDWAAEQENLINITPRTPTLRTFVPPNNIGFIIMTIVAVLVLPGLVVFAGVSSWLARRKRG
jgi:ABC-type uncharacterized transport system involved in gliding motility auxiliary subunit